MGFVGFIYLVMAIYLSFFGWFLFHFLNPEGEIMCIKDVVMALIGAVYNV